MMLRGLRKVLIVCIRTRSKMTDILHTGNWTYFVGNFDGRSVHVKDFSTYGQNSMITLTNFVSYRQYANINSYIEMVH